MSERLSHLDSPSFRVRTMCNGLLVTALVKGITVLGGPNLMLDFWMPVGAVGILLLWALSNEVFKRLGLVWLIGLVVFYWSTILAMFPSNPNEQFFSALCLTLILLGGYKHENADFSLTLVRYFCAIVLLWAGLQKLLYGLYFDGTFLAYMAAVDERFATFAAYLASGEDLVRLNALNGAPGSGPYDFRNSPLLLIGSNVVWLGEIFAALALYFFRFRVLTVILSIFFLGGIQLIAREFYFFWMFVVVLSAYLPGYLFWMAQGAICIGLALLL